MSTIGGYSSLMVIVMFVVSYTSLYLIDHSLPSLSLNKFSIVLASLFVGLSHSIMRRSGGTCNLFAFSAISSTTSSNRSLNNSPGTTLSNFSKIYVIPGYFLSTALSASTTAMS